MTLKEDDIVMCTVKSIEGTSVFLEIDGGVKASMTMSEVAAGRIRNLREYITVNKRIVCKVLKIVDGHPQLSLRRVTGKEREELMDKNKKEKTFLALLKANVANFDKVITSIRNDRDLAVFYDEVRENPKLLDKYISASESEKLSKALTEKKEKEKLASKKFILQSFSDQGLIDIREVLTSLGEGFDIHYLGSSVFVINATAKEFKVANQKVEEALVNLAHLAKERKMVFSIKSE